MPDIPLGIWRHWKGGYYEVIAVAVHATTAESYVVYRSILGAQVTWIRGVHEFQAPVKKAGEMIPRFIYVCDAAN